MLCVYIGGSQLVEILNSNEQNFVAGLVTNAVAWIGAKKNPGGVLVWNTTGIPLTSGYTNWQPGEPNQGSSQGRNSKASHKWD